MDSNLPPHQVPFFLTASRVQIDPQDRRRGVCDSFFPAGSPRSSVFSLAWVECRKATPESPFISSSILATSPHRPQTFSKGLSLIAHIQQGVRGSPPPLPPAAADALCFATSLLKINRVLGKRSGRYQVPSLSFALCLKL